MDLKCVFFVFFAIFGQLEGIKIPIVSGIVDGISNYINSVPVKTNEDSILNITQLATKYGYEIEEHNVTTEDGYILKLHRLKNKGIPVFLMHGILESSDCWILQGPNNSLGYNLADKGFDVWMGNARGNKHSLSHVNLTIQDQKYWNFTWEEIGLYDLPASIDYILEETNYEHLYYVGHSQGTTSFYVMNSLRPEYNEKVKLMFSLAPVAWMKYVKNPLLKLLSKFLSYSSVNLYTASTEFFTKISTICKLFSYNCDNVASLFSGSQTSLIDKEMLQVIYGHAPTTCSTLQFIHYGQLIDSGRFCRYNYGAGNIVKYGNNTSPDYDLSVIKTPIVIFNSNNDWFSNQGDVKTLKSQLPNVFKVHFVINFNHIDYLYAKSAKKRVYDIIINDIMQFESKKFK